MATRPSVELRVCSREREGDSGGRGDSRDGTAIITDLLEEISTTQTGCPHHIEMIDSGGEGEQGVCVERSWVGGGVSEEGGWRRSAAGVSSSSPPQHTHTHTHSNTSSTLPSGLGWHSVGVEFGNRGQIKGLINTPV